MEVAMPACPSCGKPFTGKFCANCGEKKVSHHDFTVGHFVEESIEGITHFDNKFLRTVRALLKPGSLTAAFERGSKVPYMKPMQLFIITNILFFLFASKSNVFSHRLESFLGKPVLRAYFLRHVGPDPDMPRYSELFLEKMAHQSKAFILAFVPFYALFTALIYLRSRKPLGIHLVFATHYFSFLLFFFTLFGIVVEIPYYRFGGRSNEAYEYFAMGVNFLAIVVYFIVAARRFFRVRWWAAAVGGLSAGGLFLVVLFFYRVLLFYNIVRTFH